VRGWAGQRDVRRGLADQRRDQAAVRSGGANTPTSENRARDQEVTKLLHKRTISKHEKLGSNSTVHWRCHTS
jgi:hypothetical protein